MKLMEISLSLPLSLAQFHANSYKNTAQCRYAFNALQIKALPSEYRPPEATFG